MNLTALIQARLASAVHLYDREGQAVAASQTHAEYRAIRNYLAAHTYETDVIAIKATKDYRYFLTMLGCLELGLPYVPMMNEYPEERVEQIRTDAMFRLLLDDEFINTIVLSDFPDPAPRVVSEEKAAYIIFTSGTSGRPKGVVISRRALLNFIRFMDNYLPDITEADHLLQISEFSFDLSVSDVALFIAKNTHLHFTKFKNNFLEFAAELQSKKITTICTVPNNLAMLLGNMYERFDLKALRHFIICGARFSQGLYQSCQTKLSTDSRVYNFYGPTECTVFSHVKKLSFEPMNDQHQNNISIGQPLTGVHSLIHTDHGAAKPFEQGEILLGGEQLLTEYMNDPDRTAKVLMKIDGKTYYRTGDLGFQDEKGDYYVSGRMDDTIKCRGYRVNLLDIDSYMHRLDSIEDSAVIAIPDPVMENILVAYVKTKKETSAMDIKKELGQLVPAYQVPEKIIFCDSFPVNSNGKIDRRAIRDQYLAGMKK